MNPIEKLNELIAQYEFSLNEVIAKRKPLSSMSGLLKKINKQSSSI